jgi:glutaminyl-peptide cyclotransferase
MLGRLRTSSSKITFALLIFCLVSCSRAAGPEKPWDKVSGEKAFAHVQWLVNLGPRTPQSDSLEKSRGYIEKELATSGWTLERQTFTDDTPRGPMTFVNLIARFQGKDGKTTSQPQFLLCSHYDTKVFDNFTFVGANDGGSSTGLLLEVGRVLGETPALAAKVELVFFDGEEAIVNFSDRDGIYGSRHFANELVKTNQAKQFRGGILFDMVGDKSLDVTLPTDSPVEMARDIFSAADALHCRGNFTYFDGGSITDDHTPLNAINIPTIDLIDFDFPPWHTAGDTIDKISPESLRSVGRVALYYLSEFALK